MSTIAIDNERAILELLNTAWNQQVRPLVMAEACVLSARMTSKVLDYFDIRHEVKPLRLMVANDIMLDHLFEGDGPEQWKPEAWSVGVGFTNMVATNSDRRSSDGFEGHVVVTTDNFHVDLTAYQFDRPEHGIVSGGSIVVNNEDLVFTSALESGNPWTYLRLQQGHMMFQGNGNWRFIQSRDWCVNYKRQIDSVIRAIEENLI